MGDTSEPPSEYQLIGPAEDGQINDLLSGKTVKEGRQRLQALIVEWLRMENLVVLAGAGTAVSSGGKTGIHPQRRLKPIHLVSEITYNRRISALPANLHHRIGRTADRKTP